jgi:predicted nucleotide-binding protein (sugar kinase/HSP70/actin superfamily)
VIGLHRYHLPDMDEIAALAKDHFDVNVRGGEGHMEVGKLIHFVKDRVNHMTISVKPFGCMPSGGVSDGVQAAVQARYPEALFLAIETTGDGKVNVQSRIQMMLFRAREKALADLTRALEETRMDEAALRARAGSRRWRSPFRRPAHRVALGAANLAYAMGARS